MASDVIGRLQRSVWGSLYPLKTNLLLYMMSQYFSVNVTMHPVLHKILIPTNDAIVNPWTMCPVRTVGRPGIIMSHVCIDLTTAPLGKFILNGFIAICTLLIFKLSIVNREVVPVSATACFLANDIVLLSAAQFVMLSFCCILLDVTTVSSSAIMLTVLMGSRVS
jgi:hypothetical protein